MGSNWGVASVRSPGSSPGTQKNWCLTHSPFSTTAFLCALWMPSGVWGLLQPLSAFPLAHSFHGLVATIFSSFGSQPWSHQGTSMFMTQWCGVACYCAHGRSVMSRCHLIHRLSVKAPGHLSHTPSVKSVCHFAFQRFSQ